MARLRKTPVAAAALILPFAAGGCGGGEPEPDNAAIDRTLNQIIANEQANRERLVEEARDREDIREREMEQREENYGNAAD